MISTEVPEWCFEAAKAMGTEASYVPKVAEQIYATFLEEESYLPQWCWQAARRLGSSDVLHRAIAIFNSWDAERKADPDVASEG